MEAEQKITPWNVEVISSGKVPVGINYDKVINQFGCQKLEKSLLDKRKSQRGQYTISSEGT